MRALVLGGVLTATCFVACFIDRPTDELACSTSADCGGFSEPRHCTGGYCVVSNCPRGCTSCDETQRTCTVACSSADSCGGTITCPPGWTCAVSCVGGGACNAVECQTGSRCTIACNGAGACGDVRCASACQCDLDCVAGACGSMECPVRGNGANQVRCTTDQTAATECDSTVDTRCTSC